MARELQTREFSERPKQWTRPEHLPEPDKQPGYSYHWVRVSTLNDADPKNIASKIREGYEPVPLEEQPRFKMVADRDPRIEGSIVVGGLMLCKIPQEFVNQRNAYYAKAAQDQAVAVNSHVMREASPHPSMPIDSPTLRTMVTFGKGS